MKVRDLDVPQFMDEWNMAIRDQVKLSRKRGVPKEIKHKSRRMIKVLNMRVQLLPVIDDFELTQVMAEWRVAVKQARKTLKHMLTKVVTQQSLQDTQSVIEILSERIKYYEAYL